MRAYRVGLVGFFFSLLVLFNTGCGKESINVPDTAPFVLSTTPTQGATGVTFTAPITATFNKAVTASTVNGSSFTVTASGAPVAGAVTLSGNTATFTPTNALQPDTLYSATITTAVTDAAGLALVQNYVWSFEAIEVPSPVSTNPASNAVGVPVNQVITASFLLDSDSPAGALNCSTVTAGTFTLASPAGAVAGTVTCSGATATFTPSAQLTPNTTYTATLGVGVQNTAGSGLASPYVWTFSTGTQPTVVSIVPQNGATGVLLDQNVVVTFSRVMNCATLYSPAKSFVLSGPGGAIVPGTVACTGTGAIFTPQAPLATNTIYTVTITTAATDQQGEPLASVFTSTFRTVPAPTAPTVIATTPANNATNVALNQKIAATFSEAVNPGTVNSQTFLLTGPGGVAVSGAVTYVAAGSIATFTPSSNLAPNTTYVATITTGVQDLAVTPNGLTSNFTWTFTTGTVVSVTRPTVISTVPGNQATGVPINQAISATFSTAMDPTTIVAANFTVTGPGGAAVAGIVTYAAIGNTATFTPTANLAANTKYSATITTGAKNLGGNALVSNYVWTFTTAAATTAAAPFVVLTNPANGATGVPVNQAISATFNKAMDPLTITTATFQLSGPNGPVAGTVTYDAVNFIATFTPLANLTASSQFTATVTAGATDLAGNPLGAGTAPDPWTFTTGTVVVSPPVPLGTAAAFGGFGGGAGMTNQGTSTVINGDIGTTGVSTKITGFHDATPGCIYTETPLNMGLVNGSIDTAPPPPTVGCPSEGTAITGAIAAKAAADALTAYNDLVAFPNGMDVSTCPGCGGGSAGELGNRTLAPGIYKSAPGSYAISQGDLTLDAKGDPNAFWVFQMATTLTVGTPQTPRTVLLVNGAQAKNVFWQVGTAATINGIVGGGTMSGTIISQAGVSVSTAGVAAITTINGRLLVLSGPVTLVNTVINVPAP
jgi:methionine-rich copper-binding protein CopC